MALTDLKVARSVAKRNLTMRINATTVLLSEGEIGEIKKDELHKLYRTFVTKHEEYLCYGRKSRNRGKIRCFS